MNFNTKLESGCASLVEIKCSWIFRGRPKTRYARHHQYSTVVQSCHLHATITYRLQELFFQQHQIFVDNSKNEHSILEKGTQQQLKTHKLNQSAGTANTG